jgi:hypothetical protein
MPPAGSQNVSRPAWAAVSVLASREQMHRAEWIRGSRRELFGARDKSWDRTALYAAGRHLCQHPSRPLRDVNVARVEKGMRPTMARLTLARKMAAISLTIWKTGVEFDAPQLQRPRA